MKIKNQFIHLGIVATVIFMQASTSYAIESNFLNVKIEQVGNNLEIKEQWNVLLKENNSFEREIPLDKDSISNISANQIFPKSEALHLTENYNSTENSTSIEVETTPKSGESIVLDLEYTVALDNKTKADFINHLPYSLASSNEYKINKINLDLNAGEYKYKGTTDFEIKDEFTQSTSTTKTAEVLGRLIKLLINIISIGAVCFIGYVVALILYYRSKSKLKRKNDLKKIKTKNKRNMKKKHNTLKTRR